MDVDYGSDVVISSAVWHAVIKGMGVTPGGVRGVATPPHFEVRGLLMYSNPPELKEI